jgi:23S rRNA (cytidine1920-2'-O)/16S rRNA (cytidine1409-2'-O)-methyltransferase
VRGYAQEIGWYVAGFTYSPIKGPKGNIEFLADIRPGMEKMPDDEEISRLVEEAHNVLNEKTAE